MDIRVDVTVPTPQATIDSGFTFISIWRSDNGQNGLYYEITAQPPPSQYDNRIPIINTRNTYSYRDQDGEEESWYKARFWNPNTSTFGDFSLPIQGDADNALDVLDIETFKTVFLFGVDLSKDDGEELPDSYHEFYIKSAVSYWEQQLDLALRARTVTEQLDWFPYDGNFFKLTNHPVQQIDEFNLVDDQGNIQQSYDVSRIKVDHRSGQINVMPLSTVPGLMPFTGRFNPYVFQCKYRTGFKTGHVPMNVVELVGKTAAYGPLNAIGDLVGGAGISATSLSIDGLSQSTTTTNTATMAGYGARIILYRKEIREQMKVVREYFSGPKFTVI